MKFRKLRGRIVEKFGTLNNFSAAMGWTPSFLSLRLSTSADWKSSEIAKACELLDIPADEIYLYFFSE